MNPTKKYKRSEILQMEFRDFVDAHKSYFTQYTRIRNCGLCRSGYRVIDVCGLKRNQLKQFRNIGELSVKEIESVLGLYDLGLNKPIKQEAGQELRDKIIARITPILETFLEDLIKTITKEL